MASKDNGKKVDIPVKKIPTPVAAFTTVGLNPSSCIFTVDRKTFEQKVLEIAQTFIPDFTQCLFERGENNYDALCLWIPANSEHLQDKKAIENTILKEAPRQFSQKMQEFVKRFCSDKFNNGPQVRDPHYRYGAVLSLAPGSSVNRRYCALAVNPKPFVDLMFDYDGRAYAEETGSKPVVTDIRVEYIYTKKNDPSTPLRGLRVIKSMLDGGDGVPRTRFAIKA